MDDLRKRIKQVEHQTTKLLASLSALSKETDRVPTGTELPQINREVTRHTVAEIGRAIIGLAKLLTEFGLMLVEREENGDGS